MKGVDAAAQILKREGIEYLFSYPANALIDACAAIGIRPVIARGEKTLINMADGYTRATNGRRPTVVVVQQGPGIENAFGGVAQAAADGIPILIVPGGPARNRAGAEFDPLPPYSHVTKWAGRVPAIDQLPGAFRRAFSQLRNGPPAPVLLELPGDVGADELAEAAFSYEPPRRHRSMADSGEVAEAARALAGAKRPVIQAGHGVLWAEAWDELRQLAELLGAPVTTTMAAKSVFPEDHPLSLGAGGHTVTRAAAHFLACADVILGVGTAFSRSTFATPIPSGKRMLQITDDPAAVDREHPVELALLGDAKLVLGQLVEELKRQGARKGDGVEAEVKRVKDEYLREWMPRLTSDETPINPYRVVWELNRALDKSRSIVTHDSGNPRDQTLTFLETTTPRGYIGWGKSTQLGTGYGIALGAKLAYPEKTVVNVMGDLAFGTAGMEVETAVRERIPIMTVLLNNSVMGGYGHHMPNASERYSSNRLSGDYAAVAKGLGAYAERVERPEDVAKALERGMRATAEGQPALLEMITKEEPVYPVSRSLVDDAVRQLQPV